MKKLAAVAACVGLLAAPVGAFGAINDGPGKGNPATNESGKCPAGQNKDTSVGGLKKCP